MCVYFVQGGQFSDYILSSAGPQTRFCTRYLRDWPFPCWTVKHWDVVPNHTIHTILYQILQKNTHFDLASYCKTVSTGTLLQLHKCIIRMHNTLYMHRWYVVITLQWVTKTTDYTRVVIGLFKSPSNLFHERCFGWDQLVFYMHTGCMHTYSNSPRSQKFVKIKSLLWVFHHVETIECRVYVKIKIKIIRSIAGVKSGRSLYYIRKFISRISD